MHKPSYLPRLDCSEQSRERKAFQPPRGNAAASSLHAHSDPINSKFYFDGLALALTQKGIIRFVAQKFNVSFVYLWQKVKKAKFMATPDAEYRPSADELIVEALSRVIGLNP